jgi:hypothetical protein
MSSPSTLHKTRLVSTRPTEEHVNRRMKWARALRSGDYIRGQNQLRDANNCFCPLGVANDVYLKELSPARGWLKNNGVWEFGGTRYFLSDAAVAFYGMNRWGAFYIPSDENVHTIPEMNDTRNWPFEQVAQLLEDPRIVWMP